MSFGLVLNSIDILTPISNILYSFTSLYSTYVSLGAEDESKTELVS
jgi:hypothetical protein